MSSPEFSPDMTEHIKAWDLEVGLGFSIDTTVEQDRPDTAEDVIKALNETERCELDCARAIFNTLCGQQRLNLVPGKFAYHVLPTQEGSIRLAVTPPRELQDYIKRGASGYLRFTVNYWRSNPNNLDDDLIVCTDYLVKDGYISVQQGECESVKHEEGREFMATQGTPPLIAQNLNHYYQLFRFADYGLNEPKSLNEDSKWEEIHQQRQDLTTLNKILGGMSCEVTQEPGEGSDYGF